jgi:hypothetical protein
MIPCRAADVFFLLLLVVASLGSAWAHGALAIGIPESVQRDGFSMGFAWDKSTPDLARIDALRACLDLQTAPPQARGFCRIATTFSRQCMSIANDPGGAGWGWAVEATSAVAQSKALASCVSTVRKSCSIAATACDTKP